MFRAPFRAPFGRGIQTKKDIEITATIGEVGASGIAPSTTAGVSVTVTATVGWASVLGVPPVTTAGVSATIKAPIGFVEAEGIPAHVITLEGIFDRPPPGEVTATGIAPAVTITRNISILAALGEVQGKGIVPKTYTSTVVRPPVGAVDASGIAPGVTAIRNVAIKPPAGDITADGLSVDVFVSRVVRIYPAVGKVAAAGITAQVTAIDLKPSPVTPYIILDRVTETPLAWLDAALVSPVEIDDLTTGEMRLEIQYPITGPDAGKITKGRKIATTDIDGAWQVYEITNTSTVVNSQGMYIKASCEHEFYELQTEKYISLNFSENTAIYALEQILFGTRWQVGAVEPAGTRTVQMPDHNPLQALSRVASVWDGELRFRVEVDGNTITGRYVDLLTRRGAITGQRFEFGHNITSAQVDIDTTSLVTAMHGRGQGEDIAEGNDEAERLTFEGYEWRISQGDPADKPLGQDWIGDEAARELYGKPDGAGGRKHIFGLYESQAKTPETLIWETWHQIQKRNRPRVTADFAIADLEQIKVVDIATGKLAALNHEKARLGDTCYMIVRRDDLRIELEARIIRIERHRKDPAQTRITMGDPAPVGTDLYQELRQKARLQEARQAVHDRAALFQPGTGDYDYELDIGEKRIKIVGQTYFYWDGAGFYAIKPTDINKYWRYDQHGLRYTETGGVSWKHRFGIDELVVGSGAKFTGDIEVGSSESGNIAGISGDGSSASSVRFWAGHATPGSAPYRVMQDGSFVATKATITGSITVTGGNAATLTDLGAVETLAGEKKRVFTATPVPPYDVGDLWARDDGQMWVCITARTQGQSHSASYWKQASTGGGDYTATVIAGGLVTTGTVQVVQGGDVAAGITGNTSGNSAIRFWAGATFANRGSAPYRVTQDGKLVATDVDIKGKITATSGRFDYVDVYDAYIYDTVIYSATFRGDGVYNDYSSAARWKYKDHTYIKHDIDDFRLFFYDVGEAFNVRYTGKVYATSYDYYSSRERKENIEPSSLQALETVNKTNIYEFNMKGAREGEDDRRHLGPMVEDLPEELQSIHEGKKSLCVGDMIGLLWKAVQELNQKVDKLGGVS